MLVRLKLLDFIDILSGPEGKGIVDEHTGHCLGRI